MPEMTDEEADYWDEYFTANPPELGPNGTDFLSLWWISSRSRIRFASSGSKVSYNEAGVWVFRLSFPLDYFFRVGKVFVNQLFYLMRPIFSLSMFHYFHTPPAFQRCGKQTIRRFHSVHIRYQTVPEFPVQPGVPPVFILSIVWDFRPCRLKDVCYLQAGYRHPEYLPWPLQIRHSPAVGYTIPGFARGLRRVFFKVCQIVSWDTSLVLVPSQEVNRG
jgi:hypothetical protein